MTDAPPTFRFSRIPVWAIAGWLIIQSITAVMWAAKIDDRMAHVEAAQASAANDHALLARMDERTANLKETVDRIDARLGTAERRR